MAKPRTVKSKELVASRKTAPAPARGNKLVCLIFEDKGGEHFDFYCTGIGPELDEVPQEMITPAEAWGLMMFRETVRRLQKAKVIHSVGPKDTTQ